ncbi:hypothetical protein [Demequina sp.]|uniref:hypothetical protein n=1 Tax=Demequina sp. TaxID=2050685 RepID=UPI003A879BC1
MGSALLDAEVARYVARGYGIESRTPTQVVLAKQRRVGWFCNTLLVIVTGGLWLIYVIYRLANRKYDRVVLTVDGAGGVHRS